MVNVQGMSDEVGTYATLFQAKAKSLKDSSSSPNMFLNVKVDGKEVTESPQETPKNGITVAGYAIGEGIVDSGSGDKTKSVYVATPVMIFVVPDLPNEKCEIDPHFDKTGKMAMTLTVLKEQDGDKPLEREVYEWETATLCMTMKRVGPVAAIVFEAEKRTYTLNGESGVEETVTWSFSKGAAE